MKYRALQHVTVEVEEKNFEQVFAYLADKFPKYNWSGEIEDEEIYGSTYCTIIYEPEVRYTKNGDGSPAIEYTEDGLDKEWLEEEIKDELGIEVEVTVDNEGNDDYE